MKTYPKINLTLTDWKPKQEKQFKKHKTQLLRERESKLEVLAWRSHRFTFGYND